jgi:hypothetical protein
MTKNTKVINTLIIGILILTAIIIFFLITAKPANPDTANESLHSHGRKTNNVGDLENDPVISHTGIHFHPKLDIYIKGQLQPLPADVGLRPIEHPIHTHDTDNIIHLEFSGLTTLNNTRVQEFFKIWDKQFNSNCIFDYCNGSSGTVKMFVNGQPNTDFEKYPMKDDDKIEIRYE